MMIVDGLELYRIYWVRGNSPKGSAHRFEVKDTPCSGWQNVLLMRGEKRSTLFCPYSMTAFQVTNRSGEMHSLTPTQPTTVAKLGELLLRNWNMSQRFGWQRDYDVAVLIFKLMGLPVPEQIMRGGEEDTRKRGGKEVRKALTKPVKADGKRGIFLKWFMDGNNSRSIREAMAEFSMTRSNALSYLYMIQKDHGIGYSLQGDNATLTFPEGCTNPFLTQAELDALAPETLEDDLDDIAEDDDTESPEDDDTEPGDIPDDNRVDDLPDDEDEDAWLN